MVHLYILNKMEVQFGLSRESLEWLQSYLEGWVQYTVVEASNSTPRRMKNGVLQGGGLSPIIWRSATNDLPEAGLRKINVRRQEREQVDGEVEPGKVPAAREVQQQQEPEIEEGGGKDIATESVNSMKVERIQEDKLTSKERLDKKLRQNGKRNLDNWKNERISGEYEVTDSLKFRKEEDEQDVVTTIYTDDTQSKASAKTLKEL